MKDGETHYELIGVDPKATAEQVTRACFASHRRYAEKAKAGDSDAVLMVKRIDEAHDVLCDSEKRAAYDADLRKNGSKAGTGANRGILGLCVAVILVPIVLYII